MGSRRWRCSRKEQRVTIQFLGWRHQIAFGVTWETYDDWGNRLVIRLLLPFFTVAVKFR